MPAALPDRQCNSTGIANVVVHILFLPELNVCKAKQMKTLTVCMAFITFSGAMAQENAAPRDTISPQHLRETVVSAQRKASDINAVQTISGENLRQAAAYSVADAIRFFSGVQLKDYGGIGGLKTVNVRSMGTEHTAVAYDGVEITNAQNGIVDLGRLSVANVGGIVLSNGGNGNIFKPARSFASASSVEIIARQPEFNGKPYNLRAILSGGSFGTFSPELLWEQKISRKISLQTNVAWLTSTGRYKYRYHLDGGYDTTATRKNGDITVVRGEATLFGHISNGNWKARGYIYSSRRGLPGAIVRNRLSHIDRQRDVNSFAQGMLRKRFGKYSLLVNGKLSYDYLHYLYDSRRDQGAMYVDNHYHQSGVYLSAANKYDFSEKLQASLSADYAFDALRADLKNFAKPVRNSIYAAAAINARPGKTEIQGNILLTHVDNRATNHNGGKSSAHTGLTPALSFAWRPTFVPGLTLRVFAKRSYRVPTLNDLYYTFIGNSNLKPEYASQIDGGVSWSIPGENKTLRALTIKADVYTNRITQKIIAVPTTNQFRWTMVNLGKVITHGLDASAESAWSFGEVRLGAKATYSWQRAMDCSDKSSPYYKGQIAYIPKHSASAVADMAWRKWSANYSFLYTGHRYDGSANIPANYIRSYYINDFAVNRDLCISNVDARISLAVNNILNRHYDVVRCYPMPGRNYKITLLINL